MSFRHVGFKHGDDIWLCFFICLFLAVLGLCCCDQAFSSCGKWGLLSSCSVWAPHYSGFSLQSIGFRVVAHGLSCPHSMWNLPGPVMEPTSPALAVRLLTTGPPGKSLSVFLKHYLIQWNNSAIRDWIIDRHITVGESPKDYAEWKKLDTVSKYYTTWFIWHQGTGELVYGDRNQKVGAWRGGAGINWKG